MVLTALLTALTAQQAIEPNAGLLTPGGAGVAQLSYAAEDYIPDIHVNSSRPGEAVLGGLPTWAGTVWKYAAKEEGIRVSNASYYARQMMKFPRSWVSRLRNMSHEKTHGFNFIGSDSWPDRHWVVGFAKRHFGEHDVFEWSDGRRHRPLALWDQTGRGRRHGGGTNRNQTMDEAYWQTICSSNFTLCPRGDHPYSLRFLEAIAAGSIPVVRSVKRDLDSPFWMLTSVPYRFVELDHRTPRRGPLEFRQDWVDENTRLFIRYNTFMEGDNVPPGWTPPEGMREEIAKAER